MSDIKTRAMEIYQQHIALAATDGRLFRKTVREQIMTEFGASDASASTHYNNCKKASAPIEGLGRAPVPAGLRKPGAKNDTDNDDEGDEECFTVLEVNGGEVGRTESFSLQGDASESFDSKIDLWPRSNWKMIKGLGPNGGDKFKLGQGEEIIKEYKKPAKETA